MAKDTTTETPAAGGPASLRQRAVAIQVIGAPAIDRSASRQRRLGASLLLALYFGWNPLMQAMSGPVPFHSAMGRFLFIFLATVGSVRVLGNLYDDYAEQALSRSDPADAGNHALQGQASPTTANQPATGGEEGLGSDR